MRGHTAEALDSRIQCQIVVAQGNSRRRLDSYNAELNLYHNHARRPVQKNSTAVLQTSQTLDQEDTIQKLMLLSIGDVLQNETTADISNIKTSPALLRKQAADTNHPGAQKGSIFNSVKAFCN